MPLEPDSIESPRGKEKRGAAPQAQASENRGEGAAHDASLVHLAAGAPPCYRSAMGEPLRSLRASALDRALLPLHRWVWQDAERRARKLLRFAETEADGGRDLSRAAEVTLDPLLRRLYLRHAEDEERHALLFRARGRDVFRALRRDGGARAAGSRFEANFLSPGERGLDDLRIESEGDESLLAFLHLSEEAAARRFVIYQEALAHDPETRDVFRRILHDEAF